jgi:hypothetical protein
MFAMAKSGSNTASLQPKKKGKPRGKGRPFKGSDPVTGEKDPRINLKGRPRVADELKKYILDMLEEEGENAITHQKITVLRQMILSMALGNSDAGKIHILDRAYGKVADEIIFSHDDVQKIFEYLPQDMLERIAKGESIGDVLVRWITTLGDGTNSNQQTKV